MQIVVKKFGVGGQKRRVSRVSRNKSFIFALYTIKKTIIGVWGNSWVGVVRYTGGVGSWGEGGM